jgi:predicted RND superfamily exporter protein
MLIFAVITAVSAFMIPKVKVNYDLADYLPQEYISTKSISFMKSEFGDMPNARVVLRDVSRKEVMDYKARLEALDGVESVTWLDSVMPASIPEDVLPEGITDVFYKNGNALLILTVNEDKQYQTIPEIYELIGEDNQLSGNAVTTVVAAENTVSEGIVITIAAILIMLLVLTVTTTSWIEPLVIMFGLIVAVIINTGTNLIFGSVSFLTSATGMLLQIAVALDYSVFLIHRFESCRSEVTDPEEAMAEALTLSSSSIVSKRRSSPSTVALRITYSSPSSFTGTSAK